MTKHRNMRSNIYEKSTHPIKKWSKLTRFHLSFELFISNYTVFLELLIIYLRILFLQNVLLIYCVVSSLGTLVFDRTNTLSLFCMIKKHLILSFSWFINNQRFHWCSVNKSLGTLTFITFATHVIVITLITSIVFAFIRDIITNQMVLFIRSLEILLFLSLICLFN